MERKLSSLNIKTEESNACSLEQEEVQAKRKGARRENITPTGYNP